ncbi:type I cytoskeletal 28, putative [Babesia ovata]|uniref:Type I cytoskeletal 28, putative n=1 Tax=Babesia ovata TaxID=189622 RepID=A0A2H6KH52_9APIC|nr:type I cytoskeletal 28, putative [Babesia ovata]GBE62317.1 type I cytoskeletal 28, putative [Babesia ovata]
MISKFSSTVSYEQHGSRLDHLDTKYTSVLERYDQNRKNIETKVGQIQAAVFNMEASMADNDRLTHVYNNLHGQFEAKVAEFRADAQNWIEGMVATLDVHARQQLDHISFDANLIQEQRGIIKLDDMVERLKALHTNIINDMKEVVEKRLASERKLIDTITEVILQNKEEIRVEMAKALANFKTGIICDITEMSHSREEFEDFVLETLEKQNCRHAPSKSRNLNVMNILK